MWNVNVAEEKFVTQWTSEVKEIGVGGLRVETTNQWILNEQNIHIDTHRQNIHECRFWQMQSSSTTVSARVSLAGSKDLFCESVSRESRGN